MNCTILWGGLAIFLFFIVLLLFVFFTLPKIGQAFKNLVRESLEEAVSSPQFQYDLSQLGRKVIRNIVNEVITLPELREAGKALLDYLVEFVLNILYG